MCPYVYLGTDDVKNYEWWVFLQVDIIINLENKHKMGIISEKNSQLKEWKIK